ncbi:MULTISPECIES: diguanylate cyclase domain-containing protein [unclassified Pseudomonas]|uniref:sensor domain-containing diguanylate cyclase n=1 Tax=unclassified Pseudomonas TaxID=196821 RepID=UPI000BCF2EAC|nr:MULTISPECIES: diguanylate cyclase [unclassified Pseudomonas]PVZ09211.1 diguanylate cyclase (GGDEF)-like protein [Pseudomonas sp. URIL14HWK12:I12]PVZ21344.1 diguanylate cyclase (GGDEF)-like protein [Pseudomonas sp. URIL14HWK12:I10]PVZ30197.1 diguanylate cyclase (GGDEF)-like protein [Pseudomonas sp. URIL14HWK12:I11]SNZ18733.1 diguanylate cyclase (GGDEF) domain-containing protein [Pseudomonas sp. URIL14HWK12:I9]
MPSRSSLFSQRPLITALVMLLAGALIATSLLSYYASRSSIRDSIINTELPLTSDTVYSEIQKDLIRPALIASMMSRDTFLRDWVMSGEQNPQQMTRYLNEVMEHYGAYTAFFVSEQTRTYYQAKGVLKHIDPAEPRDAWYMRVREMAEPSEINVDLDMANQDKLTFFINYKVFDYQGRFIGATGVGLTVDAVVKLLDRYQQRYGRQVYFADSQGTLMLTGADGGPGGARAGTALQSLPALADLMARLPRPADGQYEYSEQGTGHFLNVRYLPELHWYLFVDTRENGALSGIRQSLYLNLAICGLAIVLMVLVFSHVLRRYQRQVEALATQDSLTDLPNRRGFNLLAGQALSDVQRTGAPLSALMLDLDKFKVLNDTHGHLAGDEVLAGFAEVLRDTLRHSDIISRWGGEEFIVLLKDTDGNAAQAIAEKVRQRTEAHVFHYRGKALRITTSVGLTLMQPGDNLERIIARADNALYRAKQSGRNRVCSEQANSPRA